MIRRSGCCYTANGAVEIRKALSVVSSENLDGLDTSDVLLRRPDVAATSILHILHDNDWIHVLFYACLVFTSTSNYYCTSSVLFS